jgi:lactoylglutathione lyase
VTTQSAAAFDPKQQVFLGPRDGRPRILHTMLRVADLDRAVRFYVEAFGMRLLERVEIEAKRATVAFVGFEGPDVGAPIELVRYRDETGAYTHGTGFGHVALGVAAVEPLFERATALGAAVHMAPGILVPGGPLCAFVKDPDGYAVELVDTRRSGKPAAETGAGEGAADEFPAAVVLGPDDGASRVLHSMLRVKDPEATIRFYADGLGMKVLQRVDIEVKRATGMFLGYGADEPGRKLEFTSYWDAEAPYTHGSGYGHVAVGARDVMGTLARLEAMGVEVTERPAVLFAGAPLRAFVKDPDGYAVELIEVPAG